MSLIPIFKKLYKKKKIYSSIKTSHGILQHRSCIWICDQWYYDRHGRAESKGAPIDDETITSVKSGLMGPMAGVGDSLDWATFKPIIFALGATLSAQGSPIGCFVLLLLPIIQMIIGTNFAAFGYRKGRSSVRSILGSGKIQQLLTAASALGIYMMGALSSTYVKLSTPLQFTFGKGNEPYVIQNILDGIVPGLLPLLAVLAVYWWLNKKNQNMVVIMLMIVAVSLVGAFFGIF